MNGQKPTVPVSSLAIACRNFSAVHHALKALSHFTPWTIPFHSLNNITLMLLCDDGWLPRLYQLRARTSTSMTGYLRLWNKQPTTLLPVQIPP